MAEVLTIAGLALCASLHVSPCDTSLDIVLKVLPHNLLCYGACVQSGQFKPEECAHVSTYGGHHGLLAYICLRPIPVS